MGSPNDGNDPWPSCIVRYEADESFKRGMILKFSRDQEARLYLARVDEAVQHGPGVGTEHWGITDRRAFIGDEQRFRLNLIGPDGQVVQRGTNTPARHTLPTFAAVTKGKAGPGKGKPTKGKGRGKTSAVKGKDKHASGKPSKDRRPTDAPPGNWEQQSAQQTTAASSSSSAPNAPARPAQTATPAVVVETPVIPAPPARPRMFVDNDAPPAQGTAPARAASDYSGSDIRRQNRPPPAQTAPASQPYYHASSGPNRAAKASAPPDQWHGRNTDDQTAEQSLWSGHQGWDTWTQRSWQNGYQ